MSKAAKREFELLGAEASGGIWARRGFRFQDLWIAYKLMEWINKDDFHGVINEGVDDVDVAWNRPKKAARKGNKEKLDDFDWQVFQLKDTSITAKLLAEILDSFWRKSKRFPSTWSRFYLVATRAADRISNVSSQIKRTRDLRLAHRADSPIGKAAFKELAGKLVDIGIKTDVGFLLDRVELDLTSAWVNDIDSFRRLFNNLLAGQGVPADRLDEAGDGLIQLVSGNKVGSLVLGTDVTALLDRHRAAPAKRMPARPQPATARKTKSRAPKPDDARPIMVALNLKPELSCQISLFPGNAALLCLPDGTYGLIDCDISAVSQLVPYLNDRGIETLDFIAISHWHIDHYSGMSSVLDAMKRVRQILLPAISFDPSPTAKRFLDTLKADRSDGGKGKVGSVENMSARREIYRNDDDKRSKVVVTSFSPDRYNANTDREIHYTSRSAQDLNDYCSVFRVSVGERSFLISTDATIKTWERVLRDLVWSGAPLVADGLTVPNHGANSSLSREILGKIAEPSGFYAVVEPSRRFNLPAPEVLDLIRKSSGELLMCDTSPVQLLLTRDGLFEQRLSNRR